MVPLLALGSGCAGGNDAPQAEPPALPSTNFRLSAAAETVENNLTVECALDYIVDIAGEVSRTDTVIEYVGTMGGEAQRSLLNPDLSGVAFVADAFSEIQVLLFIPDGVQINMINVPPSPPGQGSRFWDEQLRFDGRLGAGDLISGEWLCAPLDTAIGGITDDSVFAEGVWFSEALN